MSKTPDWYSMPVETHDDRQNKKIAKLEQELAEARELRKKVATFLRGADMSDKTAMVIAVGRAVEALEKEEAE